MTSSSSRPLAIGLSLAVAGLLGIAYVRQKNEADRIRAENEALRRQVEQQAAGTSARAALAALHTTATLPPETDGAAVSGDPATVAAPVPEVSPELVLTPTGLAAEPRTDGLDLVDSSAVETASGIRTTLRFLPTISEPIGIVAVVVRLPADAPATIQDIQMTGGMKYAEVAKRVAEDGKFAVMQIHAEMVEDLQVQLDLSGPAVADVRGTAGIGPYDLQIGHGTVTVVKK